MTRLRDTLLATVVLAPALFWLVVYKILRNKDQVAFHTGFVAFLIDEIKGVHYKPKRIYP